MGRRSCVILSTETSRKNIAVDVLIPYRLTVDEHKPVEGKFAVDDKVMVVSVDATELATV